MGRKSDAKERLLEKAAELLPQRGYTAVGVQELCEAAAIKPGSFYYLYPSKQQLVLDMLERNWQTAQQTILEPINQADIDGLDRIQQFFLRTYEVQAAIGQQTALVPGCSFGSLGSEMAGQNEAIRQKVTDIFARYKNYLEQWLAQAVASGASNLPAAQIPLAVEALLAYYEGVATLARIQNHAGTFQRLSATALVIAGARIG